MAILVSDGAGSIGGNFVLDWRPRSSEPVVNLDQIASAGKLGGLCSLQDDARHTFVQDNVGGRALVVRLLTEHKSRAVINLVAERRVEMKWYLQNPGWVGNVKSGSYRHRMARRYGNQVAA